jgi:hypothetical protein
MSPRRGAAALTATALLVPVLLAGCGRDDFKNDPKPAVPLQATIEVSDKKIDISPTAFGAGLVNFVVANNSGQEAALKIDGPVDETSSPIPSNGNGVLKVNMQQGRYKLSIDGDSQIASAEVKVGAAREPSNNDLLLP